MNLELVKNGGGCGYLTFFSYLCPLTLSEKQWIWDNSLNISLETN